MKLGSLASRYLNKVVYKNIDKCDKSSEVGPEIGNDFAVFGTISADGSGDDPSVAFYKALNNFSCSFTRCEYLRIAMILPEKVKESEIDRYMKCFHELAYNHGIRIVGGDSKVVSYITSPHFVCTMFGGLDSELDIIGTDVCDRKIIAESDIVCAGNAGILGTNILLKEQGDLLSGKLAKRFISSSAYNENEYSTSPVFDIINRLDLKESCEIYHAHDVSDGGVYRALWEIGERFNKGLIIENNRIPIEQKTIEICEAIDINPYMIDGTGSVLFVCKKGRELAEILKENGIAASVIGHITNDKERLVNIADDYYRKLEP